MASREVVGPLLTLLQRTGFRLRAGALHGTRYQREWWSFWYPHSDIPDVPPPESPGPELLHLLDIRAVLVIGRSARASRIHVGYVWHLGEGWFRNGNTIVNPDGYRLAWAIPLGRP